MNYSLRKLIVTLSYPKIVTNYSSNGKIVISGTDKYHFRSKNKVTNADIIDLVGGIPHHKITKCEMTLTPHSEHTMRVHLLYKASGKRIAMVIRVIDFNTKTIQNEEIKVYKEKLGVCTNAFINQVVTGRKFGFKKIETHAAGGIDWDPQTPDLKYQGYYKWQKYGYIMYQDSQDEFEQWIKERNRKEKTLWKLWQSEAGYELWKKEGRSWNGYFDLSNNSLSMKRLKWYLVNKGINAPL